MVKKTFFFKGMLSFFWYVVMIIMAEKAKKGKQFYIKLLDHIIKTH